MVGRMLTTEEQPLLRALMSGEPVVIMPEHLAMPWAGKTDGSMLTCGFCIVEGPLIDRPDIPDGQFGVGETARFITAQGAPNTLVCFWHDDDDRNKVKRRWEALFQARVAPILKRWGNHDG